MASHCVLTLHFPCLPGTTPKMLREGLGTIRCFAQRATTSGTGWETAQISPAWAPPPRAQRLITTMDDGARVLGTVEIVPKAVTLSVNSERRAERGRALLGPSCAASCGPFIERQELEQAALAERQDKPKPASGLSRGEEERAIVQRSLEAHYRQTRDVPVPLLGNVSPRQAVGTPRRREKVAAWLKMLENNGVRCSASDPMAGYNLSWMGQNSGSSGCGAEGSAIIVASLYGVTEFGGNWI